LAWNKVCKYYLKTIMKRSIIYPAVLFAILFSSCSVVGGIFKAGMVWGILLVVIIVVGIIALITRGGKK
jgi:hypothetical protein